ncbi:deoxyguanosinetriphosphate triphosphohydrolase [Porphyrobacter sp. GA68]|uniref:deoxyguanosinetriphosphate triphosphohydrolase n=1 Tax=Porphyrobacter sp. GA68 TaxID=2883480 RepID=UPI001D18380F|nr:deoxyguanosinetriphosphate triphosphohydrolase [Porphyrobacter sp. GA68]
MKKAPYASDPEASRGREFRENRQGSRGPRSEFQRDRDRIIHSIAFRRLRSKTQVFIAPDGDHYRTRLTHTLEVAQIGRVIARALGLDEDLTEALCLGHDLGHPPFGHAGELALAAAMEPFGGFDHNAHTIRTVTRLERPYIGHDGLNLCWETVDGLAKHNGPVAEPNWALAEIDAAFPLELDAYPSLEAQVAAVADDIAYDNHDIDDGLRAGKLDADRLLSLDFVADLFRELERRHPLASRAKLLRELVRTQIGQMVNDVIEHTSAQAAGLGSVAEVRSAGRALGGFSPEWRERERRLKTFMYQELYHHPDQAQTAQRAGEVVARLFAAYSDDHRMLPTEWRDVLPVAEPERSRCIADFIAGMTDRYAIDRYAQITGERPRGLTNV